MVNQFLQKDGICCERFWMRVRDSNLHPFSSTSPPEDLLQKSGLKKFADQGQLKIITGMSFKGGVGKLVADSRGVLIPSIWPTTTEYTLLESLGLGKPVVCFSVGIHAEVIRTGENGLLADIGDIAMYIKQIKALRSDSDQYTRISKGARELFHHLTNLERLSSSFSESFRTGKVVCGSLHGLPP